MNLNSNMGKGHQLGIFVGWGNFDLSVSFLHCSQISRVISPGLYRGCGREQQRVALPWEKLIPSRQAWSRGSFYPIKCEQK